ncbi:hypothetical protein ACPZMI_21745 [Pseudomonas wayambapalatensis]|uniref:hypothetical protein n=1 Tax=Pseudomonas wayambapalatensis TaxID=485895 RepID=UPI003CF9BB8A
MLEVLASKKMVGPFYTQAPGFERAQGGVRRYLPLPGEGNFWPSAILVLLLDIDTRDCRWTVAEPGSFASADVLPAPATAVFLLHVNESELFHHHKEGYT